MIAKPIDLNQHRKRKQMRTEVQEKPKDIPEEIVEDKEEKRGRKKREPLDMKAPERKLGEAGNRKEIAQWHTYNPAGLVAKWDKGLQRWLSRGKTRDEKDAPGKLHRDNLEKYGTMKGWPSIKMLNEAIQGIMDSIPELTK